MRDVAIASFAQVTFERSSKDEVELLVDVITRARAESRLSKSDIGFTCSASCDYLGGRPFSFVSALDAVGAWPPISESHVEMDGAWALYEAWVRLQHGDVDAALVYAFGRSSQGNLNQVLSTQLDPYFLAPLWPDGDSLAGLQARAMIDAGVCSEDEIGSIATPRYGDGAAAMVLVAGPLLERASNAAVIRGIDHRIEAHSIGARDLTRSSSTQLAAEKAGACRRDVDVAVACAPYAHQEVLLRRALSLTDRTRFTFLGSDSVYPYIVAGLNSVGEAFAKLASGQARSAVAHATSGPCLQQNLVCLLEVQP